MNKADKETQKRLEGASIHKRGDRVHAVRDMLNLRRSRVDIDTDFQPRLKAGALWLVDGYEAAWPEPHYRLRLLDGEDWATDWWLVAPGNHIEASRSGLTSSRASTD